MVRPLTTADCVCILYHREREYCFFFRPKKSFSVAYHITEQQREFGYNATMYPPIRGMTFFYKKNKPEKKKASLGLVLFLKKNC